MSRLWDWVKRYWRVLGVLAGVLLMWFFFPRKSEKSFGDVRREINAGKARTEFKKLELEVGKKLALDSVENKYRLNLSKLDHDQKLQAEELRNDPSALAEYLVRVGSSV